jgi:hypothetical protein
MHLHHQAHLHLLQLYLVKFFQSALVAVAVGVTAVAVALVK